MKFLMTILGLFSFDLCPQDPALVGINLCYQRHLPLNGAPFSPRSERGELKNAAAS